MANTNINVTNNYGIIKTSGGKVSGGNPGSSKKYNYKKTENANNINRIIVESFVDINITTSNSNQIVAQLEGKAQIDGNLKFNVQKHNDEINISISLNGSCYNSELKLNISIPNMNFKEIFIKTKSANVKIGHGVTATVIKAKTKIGEIESQAKCSRILFIR